MFFSFSLSLSYFSSSINNPVYVLNKNKIYYKFNICRKKEKEIISSHAFILIINNFFYQVVFFFFVLNCLFFQNFIFTLN